MKRILSFVCLNIALGSGLAWGDPPRAAMVTEAAGAVQFVGPGKPSPARTLLTLESEARLVLGPGARTRLIFFRDGHRELAQGPCEVRITPAGAVIVKGQASCLSVEKAVSKVRFDSGGQSLERMGGSALRGIQVLATMELDADTPRFTWNGDPTEVELFDCQNPGEAVWSSPLTTGMTVDYKGPPLKVDTLYRWRVLNQEGHFKILSAESLAQVRQAEIEARAQIAADGQDPSPQVMLMAVYADHYMLKEAIASARRALALRPSDPGLHRGLQKLLLESREYLQAAHEGEEAARLEKEQ